MNAKDYLHFSGIIFIVVAMFHALRVILGWNMLINGWPVPSWFSLSAVVLTIYLAYTASHLGKK